MVVIVGVTMAVTVTMIMPMGAIVAMRMIMSVLMSMSMLMHCPISLTPLDRIPLLICFHIAAFQEVIDYQNATRSQPLFQLLCGMHNILEMMEAKTDRCNVEIVPLWA